MKDKKNLFDMNPSFQHVEKVKVRVEELLKQKRQEERRKIFAWFAAPAFATVFGFFLWKKNEETPNAGFLADQDLLQEFEDAGEVELVAELEVLENYELLEEWDGREDA